jgi:hypothetical protein
VLDVGIGVPFDDLLDLEAGRRQGVPHLFGPEEGEVERDPLPPPLVQVQGVIADVEGEEQQAARFQHPFHLAERGDDIGPGEVDDRIEGGDAAPGRVLDAERSDVPLPELDPRVEPAGRFHHPG